MKRLNFNLLQSLRKGPLAKKILRLAFDVCVSLMALGSLCLLILLGRLSLGPLNLDSFTPDIERALHLPSSPFKISIEHTQLVWRSWKRPFEIELVNVRVQKAETPAWLKVDHVGVSLRYDYLLQGDIRIGQLRFYHPHVMLERDAQGAYIFGFESNLTDQNFSLKDILPFLPLTTKTPFLGKLNDIWKISIVEAQVKILDEQTKHEWEVPNVSFTLKRYRKGFKAQASFMPLKGKGYLDVYLSQGVDHPEMTLRTDFHHIALYSLLGKDRPVFCQENPDKVTVDDIFKALQHWNTPLTGKMRLVFGATTLHVLEGEGRLIFGKGTLDLSEAHLRPLPLDSGDLSFTVSPHSIELTKGALLSDHMRIQAKGKLSVDKKSLCLSDLFGVGHHLEGEAKVSGLLLDHLSALWPETLAIPAREWLTQNLRKGVITEATLFFKGHGESEKFKVDDLHGVIHGKNAEVTYLKGLPPIQHATVNSTYTHKGFDIRVSAADVKGVRLSEGRILITNLDTDNEALALEVKGKGSLSHVLDIIDHKPFEYASYADIDPKKAKGEGSFKLRMNFPLIRELNFSDIKMVMDGVFKKITLERPISKDLTAHITGGDVIVDLTQDHIKIQGKGDLNQMPSSFLYTHSFLAKNPTEIDLHVTTEPSFEDLKRLGFDCEAYGKGPFGAHLRYALGRDRNASLAVSLDMTKTFLTFPPLLWEKPRGERASLSFALLFDKGNLFKLTNLKLASRFYFLEGHVLFDPLRQWTTIHLSDFRGPDTSTQVTLERVGEGRYEVAFKGQSVNLENFLTYVEEQEKTQDYHPTDVKFSANVGALRLGPGRVFQHVQAMGDLFLEGTKTTWKEVRFRAKAGEGTTDKGMISHISGGILFDILPGSHGTSILTVNANDAGQFLRNLDIYDNIQGGQLVINAVRDPNGPYKGLFKLTNFDAHKVPLAARFAAILSPVGLLNLFSEDANLSMENFKCDFTFDDALVVIQNGIGKSMSLGFTVKGKIDRKNRVYGLVGNIIPARFINSFLNNIPGLGTLVNGGKGEGLLGMSYRVKGPFDNPDISVNPLSLLTPGFLRKIFSLGDD